MSDFVDGNAAAGVLAEVFVPDMTSAVTTCASCGDARQMGELRAYQRAPGLVLRCATCQAVQIRVTRAPGRVWLDLRGARVIQVELVTD